MGKNKSKLTDSPATLDVTFQEVLITWSRQFPVYYWPWLKFLGYIQHGYISLQFYKIVLLFAFTYIRHFWRCKQHLMFFSRSKLGWRLVVRTSCDCWPVLRLFCGMRCSDVGSESQKINQSGDFIINGQYFLFLLIGEIIAARSLEVFLVSYSTVGSGLFWSPVLWRGIISPRPWTRDASPAPAPAP